MPKGRAGLVPERFGVAAGASDRDEEVVRLCRMPCYAAWAGEALWPVGFEPVRAA